MEESEDLSASIIYLFSSVDGNETEVNSDQSDDEQQSNIDNLPLGILSQDCKLVYNDSVEESDPDDIFPLAVVQRKVKDQLQKELPLYY